MNITNNKKILFVVVGKFPTRKAFGITTLGTANAAVQAGYAVNILSSNSYLHSDDSFLSNKTRDKFSKFFSKRIKSSFFGKINFRTLQIYVSIKACLIDRKLSFDMLWVRDPVVAFLLLLFTKRFTPIICEIHRVNSKFDLLLYKFLHRKKRIVLCPISKSVDTKLPKNKYNQIILGMSVNELFLEVGKNKNLNFRERLVIAYLGRSTSSTEQLDINFLSNLFSLCESSSKNWKFLLIGFYDARLSKFKNVKMFSDLVHDKVPEILHSAHVGLVIYPNTTYFKDSFPIKLIEYAATKLLIVSTKTQSHFEILGDDKAIYFKENDFVDLFSVLESLEKNRKLTKEFVDLAFKWAKENSYSNRFHKVLKEVNLRYLS